MNQRVKLKHWQPCFLSMNGNREYVDQVVANLSLVYKDKERHASNDWTNHTVSHASSGYYSLRKQKRSLPMLFQPFQPSLTRGEKVEQPNQP